MHEPHHTSRQTHRHPPASADDARSAASRYAAPDAPGRVFSVRCAGIADARGTVRASDSLLVQATGRYARRVLAIGTQEEVRTHPAFAAAEPVDWPDRVVAPALVNAHAHLDLTHIGPQPMGEGGFASWIDMVRRGRHTHEADIAASVRAGIDLLLRGGSVAVGDIAGSVGGAPSLAPARALDSAGLSGVSFLEFFALSPDGSPGLDRALEQMNACTPTSMCLGLEPHAPYSASLGAYERAGATGAPICTHLAESMAERELIARGVGPIAAMLDGLGLWSSDVAASFGQGLSPVAHLRSVLDGVLAVHLNDLNDADVALLAESGARVAYCPRASTYFGAPEAFGPHRYRDLLAAGVPVALGTDSIINLPAESIEGRGICVLDEARLLLERDGVAPEVLAAMLYRHAPVALGLPEQVFKAGAEVLGLISVESDGGDAARALVASRGGVALA